jgi:hypothetical protein
MIEKYTEIEKYLSQLEELDKERVLSISTNSPKEAEHLRWLFYDYFHLTGSKSIYTLKVFNDLLLIGKVKPTLSNITTATKEGAVVTKLLDTVIQRVITASDSRRVLADLVRDQSISLTALSIILGEVGRVMGE